jgi:hypothetical protein
LLLFISCFLAQINTLGTTTIVLSSIVPASHLSVWLANLWCDCRRVEAFERGLVLARHRGLKRNEIVSYRARRSDVFELNLEYVAPRNAGHLVPQATLRLPLDTADELEGGSPG